MNIDIKIVGEGAHSLAAKLTATILAHADVERSKQVGVGDVLHINCTTGPARDAGDGLTGGRCCDLSTWFHHGGTWHPDPGAGSHR